MRIAVFSREFPEYCFRYANALARHDDTLLVINADTLPYCILDHIEQHPRLQVLTGPMSLRKKGPLFLLKALWRIWRFRPDYVHFQEVPDNQTPLVMLACRAFTKTILTVHDPLPHSGSDSRLPGLTRRLRDFGRKCANVFVTHGKACTEIFRKENPGKAARSIMSQHGVLMAQPHAQRGTNGKNALFFGRMQLYKGVDTFAEAAEILARKNTGIRLTIAGRGEELDRHETRLRGIPNVRVISGIVPARDMYELFHDADVVTLPYKDATQSGVAACAIGCGLPVIATRVGGLPDMVEDGVNGLLFAAGDAETLALLIEKALNDNDLRARLCTGTRSVAAGHMNWDNIADALLSHLAEMK